MTYEEFAAKVLGPDVHQFAQAVEKIIEAKLRGLPRRIYENDRDQVWRLSTDLGGCRAQKLPTSAVRFSGRVVPTYQSGWEGVGFDMTTDVGDVSVADPEAVAALMLGMAADGIRASKGYVSLVELK